MEWRLLEGVPAGQVRELLQAARRRRFSRNEVVFHRDDPGDSLHLVSKGRFAIHVIELSRGKTRIIDLDSLRRRAR